MLADGIISIKVNENGQEIELDESASGSLAGSTSGASLTPLRIEDTAILTESSGSVANHHENGDVSAPNLHTTENNAPGSRYSLDGGGGGARPKTSGAAGGPAVPPRPKTNPTKRTRHINHTQSLTNEPLSNGDVVPQNPSENTNAVGATSTAAGAATATATAATTAAGTAADPNKGRDTISSNAAPSRSALDDEPLPAGWELRFDQYGRRYYVDHTTKSTTWERPSNQPLPSGY